jgi:hypothetical protein
MNNNNSLITIIWIILVLFVGYWFLKSPKGVEVGQDLRQDLVANPYLNTNSYNTYNNRNAPTYSYGGAYPSYSYSQPRAYITYPIATSTGSSAYYSAPQTSYSASASSASSNYYSQTYPTQYYYHYVDTPTTTPAQGNCYVGGCSGQVCSDQPNVSSNCEYRAEYACYQYSRCERQYTGQCGWTPTSAFNSCLNNSY